jgi:SAM-dependent methyltransferase
MPIITPVSPWVERYVTRITAHGNVLDLACGNGRHSRYLLEQGYRVTAVDISLAGVADLTDEANACLMERDLENPDLENNGWPFSPGSFDGIVVCNYLHRPHFPFLNSSLRTGGVLIIDTFAAGNETYGKPSNPDFLLKPDETKKAFEACMNIIDYAHGYVSDPKPAIRQSFCGIKR